MAISLGRAAGGLGGFGCVDLAWMNWLRRWLLAFPAAVLLQLCPSRACTVYDLYSHGLAASLWHMIPASVLFADNGTFFVRPSSFQGPVSIFTGTTREPANPGMLAQVNNQHFVCAALLLSVCFDRAPILMALDANVRVQTSAKRRAACMSGST